MDKKIIRYNPNCGMCQGKGFYTVSNTFGTQSTTHNCNCHVFYDIKENSQDLDTDIVDMVNKEFWNLLNDMKTVAYRGKGEHSVRELELIIEQQEEELHLMKSKNLVDTKPVLPAMRLSMEEILRDAVRRQATYQVQFEDYDLDTWTAPVELTQNRMDKLLDDGSIRKVRLELEM